ncbi:MAG: hypothetical protein A4S09_15755 [Proteobacteria bacterium SG_bin7]|nr:MAG: hypothetical protein A4S09_15755 [Proteobacteria bacterium SG_bin7]
MFRFVNLFTLFLSFFAAGIRVQAAELEVVTYNTALARALGRDFNPCVRERTEAILDNVLKKSDVPTIFLFQEVFYQDAYKGLERWSYENGFNVTETDSSRNGLVIVTDLPIQTDFLRRYSCGRFMQNPGVLTARIGNDKFSFDVMSTHTNDSDGNAPDKCQMIQLKELAGHFNNRKGTVIMGGDINAGPDLKILKQKYDPIQKIWEPFRNLIVDGSRAPTETKGVTWDIENNFLARGGHIPKEQVEGPQDNSTLDHLFFKGDVELIDYAIVYNRPVPVRNCSDFETESGKTHMSDHFGVRARINLKNISSFSDL